MSNDSMSRTSKCRFLKHIRRNGNCSEAQARFIYDVFMTTLMEEIMKGNEVILIGFGQFALKPHRGHKTRFAEDDAKIDDYVNLKFTAAHKFMREVRKKTELVDKIRDDERAKKTKE